MEQKQKIHFYENKAFFHRFRKIVVIKAGFPISSSGLMNFILIKKTFPFRPTGSEVCTYDHLIIL